MSDKQNLFAPLSGKLSLGNKIVMAPMTRCRAIGNLPNELMATYYAQRGSAGLIISEGVSPSPNGLGYARIPGLYSPEQTAAWKKVTDAVHAQGGKIFAQLMHTGRVGHHANLPAEGRLLAPSAISAETPMWTDSQGMQTTEVPQAMTTEEVKQTIQEFVQASANAIAAGFDGVELHSANGYLFEQFLNPNSNQRTDEYGGSAANRVRFVLETTRAVIEKIGADKLGVRLSPFGTFNSMPNYPEIPETYDILSRELNALDIVYLHLLEPAARATEEGQKLLKTIRHNFRHLLMVNGGYDRERAEAVLAGGDADLVSFGSKFIANPDLPYRLENNLELANAEQGAFYMADEKGYTDYPALAVAENK